MATRFISETEWGVSLSHISSHGDENLPSAYVCSPAVAPHRRDYQERQIEAGRIERPPPNVRSAGAVFHEYMYVVYLLFKSKDKAAAEI